MKKKLYKTPLKYGEPTKLKAFNLPKSLIELLQEEAAEETAGNVSALMVRILRDRYQND